MTAQPLYHRDEPQTDQLLTRALQLRAATANHEERSIEAVLSTENPVEIYDWRTGEVIDEVLLADGAEIPSQLPLLANHARWSIDEILGSVRNIRVEKVDGQPASLVGKLHLAKDDDAANRAWNKITQGHLTDLSVGYRIIDDKTQIVAPGQTAVIAGRKFTAAKRSLRVASAWTPKEASLVPIGADKAAKTRSPFATITTRTPNMDALIRYLQTLGLAVDATPEQARDFHGKLTGDQRDEADRLEAAQQTPPASPATTPPASPPADPPVRPATRAANDDDAARRIAADAVSAERARVQQLRELAGHDVPEPVLRNAIDTGLSVTEATAIFLRAIRENRAPEAGPGIHTHDPDVTRNIRALGLALVMRSELDVEAWARRNRVKNFEELADQAERYRTLSLLDICRHALRIDGRQPPSDREELMRTAVSGGTLSGIFTTSVNATLMAAWDAEPDTTVGWVEEVDVADFKTQTAVNYEGRAGLDKLPRGQTASHMAPSDSSLTYAIARYAKQFVVDEQDIIDDSLEALTKMPNIMGESARRLRPDLIYALILANPTMVDTGALFNATALTTAGGHANLTTAALAYGSLQAGIVSMANQYIGSGRNKVALNIRPRFLIVPQDLAFTAKELITSSAIIVAGTSAVLRGNANTLSGMLETRADGRIGAAGVTDPSTGTAYTGTATNWFLAANPGRTLRCAYLRGSSRAPMVRAFALDKGQWGIGWDVKMDVGVKEMDYAGLHMSTGAG